jgi:2-polyprenyl-3-methyl-5-hydroxy-6-metoxy-1,4-benzoquinol methylase
MPSLITRFQSWLRGLLGTSAIRSVHSDKMGANVQIEHEPQQDVVPYDENLLERSRTQWQFGDWESLAKLERDTLQHHPDRAKLALLAAAGHLQQGDSQAARQFTRLAQDWGCSKKLISQILIAGVHNSLGRAAAIRGVQPRALKHFESAIAIGAPSSDQRLIIQARINEQSRQINCGSADDPVLLGVSFPVAAAAARATAQKTVEPETKESTSFDFEGVYTAVFSKPTYSTEDHLQYHFVLLKIHELGFSGNFNLLDVSSGRGHLISHINKLYPDAKVTSSDIKRFHQEKVSAFIKCDLSIVEDRSALRASGEYDIVTCTDVLEHLEKHFIADVLKLISDLSKHAILAIANHSDVWNGQELHIIQEGNVYWENLITMHFEIIFKQNTYNDRLMLYVLKRI